MRKGWSYKKGGNRPGGRAPLSTKTPVRPAAVKTPEAQRLDALRKAKTFADVFDVPLRKSSK